MRLRPSGFEAARLSTRTRVIDFMCAMRDMSLDDLVQES
jgi:hypothetical protein